MGKFHPQGQSTITKRFTDAIGHPQPINPYRIQAAPDTPSKVNHLIPCRLVALSKERERVSKRPNHGGWDD